MDSILGPLRSRLGETQLFASAADRRRFLLHSTVAVVAVAVGVVLLRRRLAFLTSASELREFIRGYGVWAPLVLIGLQTLQVVLAPVPGQILAVVAGYLFGAWWGTLYNMIGITLGSAVAFWLSRRFGRSYVERVVSDEALDTFDSVNDGYVRLSLFVFFLIPGLPDDVLCFAGGLTKLPLWQLVLIAAVGRAPAFFLANVVGDFLGTEQVAAAVGLAAGVLLLSAIGYLNRDRIVRLFGGER
ncbi:VTT domain-containing protein [Halobellus sp. GM3]|uniref:VTT domain-containing protein n=1 Tax=Halobellus sp. GM3 TaxID=3458410 RepID=UPI00403E010D